MRIDVLTIFPQYLAPLELSLIGKAQRDGLLDVRVHDLREFAHDRHRTVDDTPYGGGAGMVMKPEPWAAALDALVAPAKGSAVAVASASASATPLLIVPGPAGRPFTQAFAAELATRPWLAFACGRYEGIDERVYEYAADDLGLRVEVVSLGDYVLNGGEVAVLAMVEAIARLVPGVVGNAESLVEESHSDGLLEYPVYTKPASWRGRDVPPVLLGGDHGRIAAWRRERSIERTVARRPDLLPAAALTGLPSDDVEGGALRITTAVPADAAELLVLQRCCWLAEVRDNGDWDIPPVTEELDDVRRDLSQWSQWVVRDPSGRLVGGVRARLHGNGWEIGRLMLAPDVRGRGLGKALLEHAEAAAPASADIAYLITGQASAANLRRYKRAGYRPARPGETGSDPFRGTVELVKPLRRA
ncbi:tRNA (guanine37-N1)-methyltransferase [Kineosphaera limosa]|uniref:tRNA (guanine-N(1)-)-methyltransferase n=1 Tax=Kineosphaera limosa NBRC 100340 TaxID=1184609 RepID=K6VEG9_9MICO|nr:tRNA (guanosine(37)-N1)-methyltransferase TrmD [Kineosphaera limosa]NYD99420.1 tRNA (guanine37-N1)-methyltransferase [Kineosphaera limosa]GAB94598.1 tRNA (guanine-N(1)-)-methyltransferase [Kineosphaera limosa NBRC 100340]